VALSWIFGFYPTPTT